MREASNLGNHASPSVGNDRSRSLQFSKADRRSPLVVVDENAKSDLKAKSLAFAQELGSYESKLTEHILTHDMRYKNLVSEDNA